MMMKNGIKILVVDDEPDLREVVEFNFSAAGYDTATAASGEQALEVMRDGGVSLIVLDVMMGGISGIEVAEKLRSAGDRTPIIFLTALDTETDMLRGFESGGDDYISKPFSVKELLARVKAVLARGSDSDKPDNDILHVGPITINGATKHVTVDGVTTSLTKTEFSILEILIERSDAVHSRDEFIGRIWGSDVYVDERTVDVHIARLRKKLGSASSMIVNRSGYGYCIESK